MTFPPKDPRKNRAPTREELIARQAERLERIEHISRFPWSRLVWSAIICAGCVLIMGGGIRSLVVATLVSIIVVRAFFPGTPRPRD